MSSSLSSSSTSFTQYSGTANTTYTSNVSSFTEASVASTDVYSNSTLVSESGAPNSANDGSDAAAVTVTPTEAVEQTSLDEPNDNYNGDDEDDRNRDDDDDNNGDDKDDHNGDDDADGTEEATSDATITRPPEASSTPEASPSGEQESPEAAPSASPSLDSGGDGQGDGDDAADATSFDLSDPGIYTTTLWVYEDGGSDQVNSSEVEIVSCDPTEHETWVTGEGGPITTGAGAAKDASGGVGGYNATASPTSVGRIEGGEEAQDAERDQDKVPGGRSGAHGRPQLRGKALGALLIGAVSGYIAEMAAY